MRFVLVATVVAAFALPLTASANNGNGNGNTKTGGGSGLLAPDLAQAAIDAPGGFGSLTVSPVTLAQVQAAAAQPGAITDGAIPAVTSTSIVVGTPVCSAVSGNHYWGTPPYQRNLSNIVYWCAKYGTSITSITSTVSATSTWLCSTDWTNWAIVGGGVGAAYATVRAQGGWGCPTVIPWSRSTKADGSTST